MDLLVKVLVSCILCLLSANCELSSKFESNPNNIQWDYNDPRWVTLIPNRWDLKNFKPPTGPKSENSKDYWTNQAKTILEKKLNMKLNTNRAKNVIIMVGDGMGLSSQMATRSYLKDVNFELSFEKFPHSGMSKVYCVNYQVPDSACTATALFTGVKGNYLVIGLTANVTERNCTQSQNKDFHLTTIFKQAQDAGKSTGFITTTRVTDATPSATFARSAYRDWESDVDTPEGCVDIAAQLIDGDVGRHFDVIMGGGAMNLLPKNLGGRRGDGRNLFRDYSRNQAKDGNVAAIARNRSELLDIDATKTDKILGIFSPSHFGYKSLADSVTQPTLLDMTAKALEVMKRNENGFMLMIEGGRIDDAHHDNHAKLALDEMVEFHKAVEYAKANTNEDETLIVVTGDHSHPFTIGGYLPRGYNILGVSDFSTEDKKWIFSATYGHGQSYFDHVDEKTGHRKSPRGMQYMDSHFRHPSAVPMDEGTHSGEDVGVYASGPWSHLLTGVYEQTFIPHAILYAACIGRDTVNYPNCKDFKGKLKN